MKLSHIVRENRFLDGLLILFSDFLLEGKVQPWWPISWAESQFNDPKFMSWLNSLGVNGTPGKPMSGAVGRAFPIGDRFIVKFTTDQKEAQSAAILKDHDSEHAAQVYDVKRIFTIDHPTMPGRRVSLFAIVMEKLNTGVGKRMRAAGNAVYNYLDDNPGFIEDPDAVIRVVLDRYIEPRDRGDGSMNNMVKQVVMALYDVQQKTGVLSQDPHGGNMALKGKKPAFFDFGRSSTNFDHPKSAGVRITGL
jgi:hypothetical protein